MFIVWQVAPYAPTSCVVDLDAGAINLNKLLYLIQNQYQRPFRLTYEYLNDKGRLAETPIFPLVYLVDEFVAVVPN